MRGPFGIEKPPSVSLETIHRAVLLRSRRSGNEDRSSLSGRKLIPFVGIQAVDPRNSMRTWAWDTGAPLSSVTRPECACTGATTSRYPDEGLEGSILGWNTLVHRLGPTLTTPAPATTSNRNRPPAALGALPPAWETRLSSGENSTGPA